MQILNDLEIDIISNSNIKLTFSQPQINELGSVETYFIEITSQNFHALFPVRSVGFYYDYEYFKSEESVFFETLANNFHGITDKIKMESLEDELTFTAISYKTGHFILEISYDSTKLGHTDFSFKKFIQLEAGELEDISKRVNKFFSKRDL